VFNSIQIDKYEIFTERINIFNKKDIDVYYEMAINNIRAGKKIKKQPLAA